MDDFIKQALGNQALDAHTERVLAGRSCSGDTQARERLVLANLRSVILQAMMLGARGEDLRDAVQAGVVALIRALDRFDVTQGVRLSTYAWPWIRGAVLAEIHRRETVSEIPDQPWQDNHEDSAEWLLEGLDEEASDVLRLRFGLDTATEPLTRREVAYELDLSESSVRRIEAEAMRQLRTGLAKIVSRAPEHSASIPYSSIGRAADC